MTKHFGGSLLPSSVPHILKPVETPFGTLQVRAIYELGEYGLFHKHDRGECLLATHANGYSCHVLLERMARGDTVKAREHVLYILNCGGTARHLEHIIAAMALD